MKETDYEQLTTGGLRKPCTNISTIEKLRNMQAGHVEVLTWAEMEQVSVLDRSKQIRSKPVKGSTDFECWFEFSTIAAQMGVDK